MRVFWHPLSLKRKIVLIFICYAASIATLGWLSFDDLHTVGQKMEIMELTDNLNWMILEVRRYEKNYLLYRKREDLDENRRYLLQARGVAESIRPQVRNTSGQAQLASLMTAVREYQEWMDRLPGSYLVNASPPENLVAGVRETGQRMLDASEKLVAFERGLIRRILNTLKMQLTFALGAALTLGVFIPFLIFAKFFKLLHLLHQTTEHIAGGRFERIPAHASETELSRLMEAFNHMVQELEHREAQLVQTQKLSSLGTMAAGVAHQLNNPLNNISTSCQIAADEVDGGDIPLLRRMMDNIQQETIRARDIVKGLLEFSRAQNFSLRVVNLSEVTRRAITLVRSQVPAGIDIRVEIPPDLEARIDAHRFQEVLLNLLLNAAQAIGCRDGSIVVRGFEELTNGHVVVMVQDSGPGITDDIRDRIFDPFFTTKTDGHGTGLGLSIVYGIIKQHYGSIQVESREGEGTTFVIRLPLKEPPGMNQDVCP